MAKEKHVQVYSDDPLRKGATILFKGNEVQFNENGVAEVPSVVAYLLMQTQKDINLLEGDYDEDEVAKELAATGGNVQSSEAYRQLTSENERLKNDNEKLAEAIQVKDKVIAKQKDEIEKLKKEKGTMIPAPESSKKKDEKKEASKTKGEEEQKDEEGKKEKTETEQMVDVELAKELNKLSVDDLKKKLEEADVPPEKYDGITTKAPLIGLIMDPETKVKE